MRTLIALALATLTASTVDARPIERTPAQMRAELARHGCEEESRLPFPLPPADESDDWGDADYEAWEGVQWARYCDDKPKSHACRCESLRSGGRY